MSARCTGAVFERYPAGGGEFALALALADNAHNDGANIFISIDAMAVKSRQSVRAVQTHLRTMLDSDWLQLTTRGGGRGRFARYRINPEWLKGAELAPFQETSGTPELSTNGAETAGFSGSKRVQNDAQKGAERRTPYKNRKNLNTPPPPASGGACGFESIAAGYPRRAGIDAARRDWDELAPDEQLQAKIAHAIQAWAASEEWRREGGRYVPKLGKFLRDKRWLDAPGMAAPAQSPLDPPPTPEQLEANRRNAGVYLAQARALLTRREEVAA